jgi:S1-C subfamily serine protease
MFPRFLSTFLIALFTSASVVVGASHYTPTDSLWQVRQATLEVNGGCSGVAIAPKLVLTAAHCFKDEADVEGQKAVVIKLDEAKDLMLLYVDGANYRFLKVARYAPSVDEKVAVVGFPLGVGEVVTEGRVQDITSHAPDNLMLVSADIVFGNSGGPVVVRRGMSYEVVGIAHAVIVIPVGMGGSVITHLGLAVNTATIKNFLE